MSDPTPNRPIRNFFLNNWKDLGLLAVAIAGVVLVLKLDFRVGYLEKEAEKWEEKREFLEGAANEVQSLKKWVTCQEKMARSGRHHEFYWPTLECVEYPDKPAAPKTTP